MPAYMASLSSKSVRTHLSATPGCVLLTLTPTDMYYLGFPNDKTGIKALVYVLFLFDTIQTALTTHNAWHFLGSGWGNVAVLSNPGWSWIAVPLFSGIVSASVQCFFAWRIHILGFTKQRSSFVPAVIVVVRPSFSYFEAFIDAHALL